MNSDAQLNVASFVTRLVPRSYGSVFKGDTSGKLEDEDMITKEQISSNLFLEETFIEDEDIIDRVDTVVKDVYQ